MATVWVRGQGGRRLLCAVCATQRLPLRRPLAVWVKANRTTADWLIVSENVVPTGAPDREILASLVPRRQRVCDSWTFVMTGPRATV